ncbi:hypothetical protein HUT06_42125 [Actinomadura sp. NAK00032]|nr:hypothetical protein HUT06_42125 [Actinomadura sp. NAK00032]
MDAQDMTEVVGAIGIFAIITTLIIVVAVQVGATMRARAALTREAEYRRLAEDGAKTQEGIERRLTENGQHLAAMEKRMESLEKILQTVE